jgi:hypothetical protein
MNALTVAFTFKPKTHGAVTAFVSACRRTQKLTRQKRRARWDDFGFNMRANCIGTGAPPVANRKFLHSNPQPSVRGSLTIF